MPGSAGEYKPVGLGSGIGAANNSVFFAQATQASILEAAADANAAGGGYVIIPAGQITMTQALPAYTGVTYMGSGYQSTLSGSTLPLGTVLVGNSGINGYQYNQTDLGTPPSISGPFVAGKLVGAGLVNLSFKNYAYGVKIGALYNPGCAYCTFSNITIIGPTQWGFWLENYSVVQATGINVYLTNSAAVGGIMRADSSNGVFNSGNSYWNQNSTVMGSYGQRGFCSWARGGGAALNIDISLNSASSNGSTGFSQSQAATMSNTSPNIGVTDSTKFPVGMPVTFDASQNGFVTNQTYFVLTSASNVVTLGNTTYGTAIAATGNAAVNITSNGYALFEFAAQDATSMVSAMSEYGMDAEGACTVGITMQRATRNYITSGFIAGGNVINICFRDMCADNRFDHGRPYEVDQDSSSMGSNSFFGAASGIINSWQNPQLDVAGTIVGNLGYLGYSNAAGGGNIKAQVFTDSGVTGILTQRDTFTNTPQTYNLANSWTTSSNYEMFQLGWAGNIFNIGSIKAGSGASRPFQFLYGNGVVGDFGNSIANYWKFSADINIGNGFATTGGASDFLMWNGAVLAFSSSGSVVSTYNGDTGMSRFAAGVFAFGNGNAADVSATLRGKAYVATGDPGAGVASTNTLSGAGSTTISTGVGSVKMSSANPGTNTGWIKCYVGTQVAWIPTWTTNAP